MYVHYVFHVVLDENLCNHQALFADLEALVVRLECVATRLENSTGVNILAEVSKDSIVINIEATPSVSVSTPTNMSLEGFQDILNGPVIQYLTISKQIGGDVAAHSELVHKAFQAQLQYLIFATQSKQPSQSEQMQLLQPTSEQISAIQSFREKNRTSTYFNHLSAISESIPALGWVTVVSFFISSNQHRGDNKSSRNSHLVSFVLVSNEHAWPFYDIIQFEFAQRNQ